MVSVLSRADLLSVVQLSRDGGFEFRAGAGEEAGLHCVEKRVCP